MMGTILIDDELIKKGVIARLKALMPRRDSLIDEVNQLKVNSSSDEFDVRHYKDEKLRLDTAIKRLELEMLEQGLEIRVESIGKLYAIVKGLEQNEITEEFNPGRT